MGGGASLDTVDYRVRWKAAGVLPGSHRGAHPGSGVHLRAVVPLSDHPDPRRLDLRASLRDPHQRLWVRDFQQSTALAVVVLADVSASMAYRGRHDRFAVLCRIACALAHSAWRCGDRFGFLAADTRLRPELSVPVRRDRGSAHWLDRRLASFRPSGSSARGLLEAVSRLPARRSLVFLVSDFGWPEDDLREILATLVHHEVVPVVLRDPAEASELPRRGIACLRDLETGRERFVWLRSALQRKWREAEAARRATLQHLFLRVGMRPFLVEGDFDPLRMTRYFREAS